MASVNTPLRLWRRAALERLVGQVDGRLRPWLHTREGVTSASVSVVVFWIVWAALDGPLVTALLSGAAANVFVSAVARVWESSTRPRGAAFSRLEHPADAGPELEEDENAGFWRDNGGFLWSPRVWFAGTGCPPFQLRADTYLRLRLWRDQGDLPVFVARSAGRQWWWWRDSFYWESADCGPADAAALLTMLERDDEQGIEWEVDAHMADPIPPSTRTFVFERDAGRCLSCGSGELIQYERVVPWSLGGSNEPQNIRLLCAGCVRRRESSRPDHARAASSPA